MPITGFTFDSWHQYSDYWEYNLWLYYTRNSYELFFENCATMNPKKLSLKLLYQLVNLIESPVGQPI